MRAAALQAVELVWLCGGRFQGAVQLVPALDMQSSALQWFLRGATLLHACRGNHRGQASCSFLPSWYLAVSTEQSVSRMVHCAQFQTKAAALLLHRYRTCWF